MSCDIYSLPNEILISALEPFSTRSLLPLAATSRRFRGIVGRLHYYRLVQATLLREHELILECYHPSNKISTPYLFCKYLGTDGLSDAGNEPDLDHLNRLYSRFEPFLGEEHRRPRLRWPINRTVSSEVEEVLAEAPSQDVHLEAGELFSQLCTLTNLVKIGPRRGLFLSIVNVTDGVLRIWRQWLQEQATRWQMGEQPSEGTHDSSILWTDSSKNVGLKFRVLQKENRNMPVLLGPNDESPVSYALEFKELFVRTNQLLLSLETSIAQEVSHHGKAIVIASMS